MPLILGSIIFDSYAIPERIPYGGEQALAVHKLLGGQRVVDAMGPNDDDLSWSGRFQGQLAMVQANRLDALRSSGSQVPLFFGGRMYQVVVKRAVLNYERPYQIPYSVTCLPVSSPNSGLFGLIVQTVDALVSGDMASVADLVDQFSEAA